MIIEIAKITDAKEILAVYSPYIKTPVTFETAVPSEEEFEKRICEISTFFPYFVVKDNGKIIGYAYAHKFKERAAYRFGAEVSIYLSEKSQGRGVGKNLYLALMEILSLQGMKTVYGVVTLPNEKSEKLHRSLGFELVGKLSSTGYKNERWWDVGYFEKKIGECHAFPQEPVSIHEVGEEKILQILKKYEK